MGNKMDELKDSSYDGIQEYDNDLPKWWLWLFYFTIAFSVVYVWYYHMGPGQLPHEKLKVAMADLEELKKETEVSKEAETTTGGPKDLSELLQDEKVLAKGKEIYMARCVACHGDKGQGTVGPNLTDKYWIHGGELTDIRHTIAEGVPDKGMLSWKTMISASDIDAVTVYTASLQGTNPPNGKEPQGELVE